MNTRRESLTADLVPPELRKGKKLMYLVVNLPPEVDIHRWHDYCAHVDEWANIEARKPFNNPFDDTVVPRYRTSITYPALRGLNVPWPVMVAYRGQILWGHRSAGLDLLEESDLRDMDETFREQMKEGVGELYSWVLAHPVNGFAIQYMSMPESERHKPYTVVVYDPTTRSVEWPLCRT